MRMLLAWLRRLNPIHHAERRYDRDRKDDRVVKRLEAVKRRSERRMDQMRGNPISNAAWPERRDGRQP